MFVVHKADVFIRRRKAVGILWMVSVECADVCSSSVMEWS